MGNWVKPFGNKFVLLCTKDIFDTHFDLKESGCKSGEIEAGNAVQDVLFAR